MFAASAFGPLLHEHFGRLDFIVFLERIVFLHLFEKLLTFHKNVPSQVGRILFPTQDVPRLLVDLQLHDIDLLDLNQNVCTCFSIYFYRECIWLREV